MKKKHRRDADSAPAHSVDHTKKHSRRDPALSHLVDSERQEEGERSKKAKKREMQEITVVANQTYFDGLRRWRRGSKVKITVEVVDGKPRMPRWAVTPDRWEEIRQQEEEEAKNSKNPIRGGVKGVPL